MACLFQANIVHSFTVARVSPWCLIINPICLGGGAQCALLAVIALKTQKNEKNFFKKYKFAPPTILPAPPLAQHFTQCIEMLKNPLVVLKNPTFTALSPNCRIIVKKPSKSPR